MPHSSRQVQAVGHQGHREPNGGRGDPIRSRTESGAGVARFLQRGWHERGDLVRGLWPAVAVGVGDDG